jgi:hypothetical protein
MELATHRFIDEAVSFFYARAAHTESNRPNPVIRIRRDTHRLTVFPYIGKPVGFCVAQN